MALVIEDADGNVLANHPQGLMWLRAEGGEVTVSYEAVEGSGERVHLATGEMKTDPRRKGGQVAKVRFWTEVIEPDPVTAWHYNGLLLYNPARSLVHIVLLDS